MIEEASPQFCWQECVMSSARGFVGSTVPGSAAPLHTDLCQDCLLQAHMGRIIPGFVLLAALAHTVVAREQMQVDVTVKSCYPSVWTVGHI